MKVKVVDPTFSDQKSAQIFFSSVSSFWNITQCHALDMFARNGKLTVENYRHLVRALDVWELGEEHRPALEAFLPDDIKIGCSYKTASETTNKYDFIVVDTPQGVHTDWQGRKCYEHFSVLPLLPNLIADRCLLVLYVNKSPYNRDIIGSHGYDEYSEYNFNDWTRERVKFYGSSSIDEAVALGAYRNNLSDLDLVVARSMLVPCFSDVPSMGPYAFRLCLEIFK